MKHLFILSLLLSWMPAALAQTRINGTILSFHDKIPLKKVSIKIKNNKTTLFSDDKGNFSLMYTGKPINLEISYIGYESQEVTLISPSTTPLIILLKEDILNLKEVMISTGYQQLPKERATGSFTLIDQNTLREQVSTNILDRLEGVTNSVVADRNTSAANGRLMIRGLSTIQGPKEPLIILDNFPYEGNTENINPNDVASITILKDAAAASIWGARAGNGVIVITTKKGKLNQKLSVDFNINQTLTDKPDLFYIPQISSSDFIDVETMLYSKGYYKNDINSPLQPALSPVVELLIKQAAASGLEKEKIGDQLNALKRIDVRDEFNKYFYRQSLNQQYAVNLNGGSEIMSWLVSSGYDRNISNLNAPYDRLSLRVENMIKPTKQLELNIGITYTNSKSENGRPEYGSITGHKNSLAPYTRFTDDNGNPLALPKLIKPAHALNIGKGKLLDWQYYPLEDYKHNTTSNIQNSLLANIGLRYKLPFGISTDIRYQYQRQQTTDNTVNDQESYRSRNLVNTYTQISKTGEAIYKIPMGGILEYRNQLMQAHNLRGQLNLDKSWNDHSVSAIAGAEFRETNQGSNGLTLYGYNHDLLSSGLVDYTQEYPSIINGSKQFIPPGPPVRYGLTRFVSLFSNAAYTYKNKYTFSISGRRDASNLFGLNTNDKWNPLWSSGLSWEISKEPFYKNSFLSYLKLRLTYGFSGNVDPSKSAVTTILYQALSPYTLTPYARFNKFANPELKWETNRMINLGIDFSFAANRVNGSIEYYQKKGGNLFGTELLDYTSGIGSTIMKNVASTKGHGVDLELNSLNINQDFKWRTNLNISYNQDRITEYYLSNREASVFLTKGVSGLKGKPTYAVFAYKWAGLDPQTGEPRGYLNNEISKNYNLLVGSGVKIEDLKYYGSAIPTLFGSIGNTFSYQNLSLTFRMMYKFGYYFRRNSINYSSLYSQGMGHADFSKRWKQPGDETTTNVPAYMYPFSGQMQTLYSFGESLVERGDHIRLHYVQLSYQLNKENFRRLPMKTIHLSFNINNMGILWSANKEKIDPDFIGEKSIPNPRSYSFGLRTNF